MSRRALLARQYVGAIGTVIAALVTLGCGEREAPSPAGGAASPAAASPTPFAARFVDATERSGITFRHENGMAGEKLLPETMGSGVVVFDFDGDQNLDLFLVNSRRWDPSEPTTSALYRGTGDGRFTDVTAAFGVGIERFGMGASAADVDGDGDVDLFVTAVDGNVFLRNDGDRFVDATEEAGLTSRTWADDDGTAVPEWSTASAWFDADQDGDLDLFVANYCRWTRELDIFTTLDGITKAFTTPDRYEGLPCRLFFNDGSGRFAEGAAREDLEPHAGKALGVALWDFDGDGRLDVVVANDTRPNFVFMNLGGGRFAERGFEYGIAYDSDGRARAGMGIDVADPTVTGTPVVAIGNFSGEPISLFRWTPPAGFVEEGSTAGVVLASLRTLAFGLAFFDADLDGHEDLLVVNGHIEPQIDRFVPGQRYAQPAQLYRGSGVRFEEVPGAQLGPLADPRVGRGLAYGDFDRDGDLDLVVTENGGAPVVVENRVRHAGEGPPFVRVDLRGPPGNPRAIGARVELVWNGRRQVRFVRTGSSYSSQSETTLTFGLGERVGEGELVIQWPEGTTSKRRLADHDVNAELGVAP